MSAPTIIGTGTAGLAAGWSQVFDYRKGLGSAVRVRVLMGPSASLDAVIAAAIAELRPQAIEPAVTAGSAIATLRIEYSTDDTGDDIPATDSRAPQYQITPLMEVVDLRAHPKAKSIAPHLLEIEKHINAGDLTALKKFIDSLSGNVKISAEHFAALWVAGVQSWEAAAFQLSVTRWYKSPPNISGDYQAINKVFSWGNIATDGLSIPSFVKEPKWVDHTGAAKPLEWRLVGVTPTLQRYVLNTVTWQYVGRQGWAKELYDGGTWEAEALW